MNSVLNICCLLMCMFVTGAHHIESCYKGLFNCNVSRRHILLSLVPPPSHSGSSYSVYNFCTNAPQCPTLLHAPCLRYTLQTRAPRPLPILWTLYPFPPLSTPFLCRLLLLLLYPHWLQEEATLHLPLVGAILLPPAFHQHWHPPPFPTPVPLWCL